MQTTDILLITPPFCQLNVAYPATTQLKGFLQNQGFVVAQSDLSIEVTLRLFNGETLRHLFEKVGAGNNKPSAHAQRMIALQEDYIRYIDPTVAFLQGQNQSFAYAVASRECLPEGKRFQNVDDLDWAFGNMGMTDQARYLCTLFLEDIGDFITEQIDEFFSFSRYAERIALSANHFDELYEATNELTPVTEIVLEELEKQIVKNNPKAIGFTIPFPGNLLSALQCGKFIKEKYNVTVIFGGGYINTELRQLTDVRLFEFADFICFDDGELPLLSLLEFLNGKRELEKLSRTMICEDGYVKYINGDPAKITHDEIGAPSYEGIKPEDYLSTLEVLNPMHRLWSDGWWNKLMLAHGCYWHKCSFCDTSLDYIKRVSKTSASDLCDRIESIIAETGQTGFHFVDEAAPPAVLRDLALELLKRNIHITWWGNIRFEKSFSPDLCRLLAASGCIAVSGGLEVASERLLELINKGVSIEQVSKVCHNFSEAGIMTHAYLMYGFPTQTEQETIDSLEIVRQLFENNLVHSAFWHQFAMTAHSPVGQSPDRFSVSIADAEIKPFANNDLLHIDDSGAEHPIYSEGLKKALYNYMHGVGFDFPIPEWFDFDVPDTTIHPDIIGMYINQKHKLPENGRLLWIGSALEWCVVSKKTKGKKIQKSQCIIYSKTGFLKTLSDVKVGKALETVVHRIQSGEIVRLKDIKQMLKEEGGSFGSLTNSQTWIELRKTGLLIL